MREEVRELAVRGRRRWSWWRSDPAARRGRRAHEGGGRLREGLHKGGVAGASGTASRRCGEDDGE